MREIEERREFVAAMEKSGALKRDHVHQIQAEIQIRVDEMNRIDRMLKIMDAKAA